MEGEEARSNINNELRPRRQKRQRRMSETISYEQSIENLSSEGKETLLLVNRKHRRPINTIPNTVSSVFDNTSLPYRWLRSGWIAEERRMLTNRLYRYFYDPKGQMYNTRQEVDHICEELDKSRALVIVD
ncbi:unnamed protein product [Cochlearia groenlandica]